MSNAIIVVGDLHLGGGPRSETLGQRLELFRHDLAFASFVDQLRGEAHSNATPCRLLILGDLFDFPRVRTSRPLRPLSDEESADKLRWAIDAHPEMIRCITELVAAGCNLDIVPGNHDLQLMRPPIFEEFRRQFNESDRARVTMHPWILHIPGVLYAEHGHQYHDINSFEFLLDWLDAPPGPGDRPVGAIFDDYFVDLLVLFASRQERLPSDMPDALRSLFTRPTAMATTLPLHVRAATSIVAGLLRAGREPEERRREYERSPFAEYAGSVGISVDALREIDRLASDVRRGLRNRMLNLARSKMPLLKGRPGESVRPGASSASQRVSRGEHLREIARLIDRILAREGSDVPNYVFGHSHVPENYPLAPDGTKRVLNAGSWLSAASAGAGAGNPPFTFLRIGARAGGNSPAELMRWDADRKLVEPFGG